VFVILTKSGVLQQILIELSNIRFYENPCFCSQVTDGWTHGKANRSIFLLFIVNAPEMSEAVIVVGL
jgi:hypothetical protein